jgi:hypothetical protein
LPRRGLIGTLTAMSYTTIPITLTPIPVPVGIQAVNINDLLTIVSEYIGGQISANVSFFIQGDTPPTSDQGIFYNTNTLRFEDWSPASGAYVPISELQVGDMKAALRNQDDEGNGWILLDGRQIAAVPNLTQVQINNLNSLFPTGSLPAFSFLSGLQGLPASGSISGISNPTVQPVPGVIGGLTISSSYSQPEVQALRNNTEILENSTNALQNATSQIQARTEAMLSSLNNVGSNTSAKWFVFCGYPS